MWIVKITDTIGNYTTLKYTDVQMHLIGDGVSKKCYGTLLVYYYEGEVIGSFLVGLGNGDFKIETSII